MKALLRAVATCALTIGVAFAAHAQPGVSIAIGVAPQDVVNSSGSQVFPNPVVLVGRDTSTGQFCVLGASTTCAIPVSGGGGGGGGGGAVTAAAGSYAAGSIIDLGSGSSPAANTVNANLGLIKSTLGSPFQAGGLIGNTSFGISGTLPAFATTPTFNCGTGCYQATQPVSGSVSATQAGAWSVTDQGSSGSSLGQGSSGTAANSATVQGLGTAGAPAGGLMTIQGATGGQPVPVTGSVTETNYGGFNESAGAALAASSTAQTTPRSAPSAMMDYFGCRGTASVAFTMTIWETLAGGAAQQVRTTNTQAANATPELEVKLRGNGESYYCQVSNLTAGAGTYSVASSFTVN